MPCNTSLSVSSNTCSRTPKSSATSLSRLPREALTPLSLSPAQWCSAAAPSPAVSPSLHLVAGSGADTKNCKAIAVRCYVQSEKGEQTAGPRNPEQQPEQH